MEKPRIFADFNDMTNGPSLRLNCRGTIEDLKRLSLELQDGLEAIFSDGELEADGVVRFLPAEEAWVAVIAVEQIRSSSVPKFR
jgi:hypothetical protein